VFCVGGVGGVTHGGIFKVEEFSHAFLELLANCTDNSKVAAKRHVRGGEREKGCC
jgi:hypothetical protein